MSQSKVRWMRSATAGAIVAVVAMVVAAAPPIWRAYRDSRPMRIVPIVASEDEQQQILITIFDEMRFPGIPPPPPEPGEPAPEPRRDPVILITTTFPLTGYSGELPSDTTGVSMDSIWLIDSDGLISERFRRELVAGNPRARTLACPTSPMVRCTTLEAFDAVFRADGWWDSFYKNYPNTVGVVRVSYAVLSSDRATAVLYVSYSCDGLCGYGQLIVLKRTGSGWKFAAKETTWIS